MTGFASVAHEDDRATLAVTVRTLNHRYLDIQLRLPQSLGALESEVRALITRQVARGRVELSVALALRQGADVEVEFNEAFGRALEGALEQARARGLVKGALTPGDLLRLPQALTIRDKPPDSEPGLIDEVAVQARQVVTQALSELDRMRSTEGAHLRADLDQRRTLVADIVERVAVAADEGRAAVEQRLTDRVAQLRSDLEADEAAVAQEIVRGHVSHWVTLADAAEPCGRKLDFLLQEMNREVNTMGSKADGLRVSELIIAAKAELEKMREQVQNVE